MKRRHLVLVRVLTISQVLGAALMLALGIAYVQGVKNLQSTLSLSNEVFAVIRQSQEQLAARVFQLSTSPSLRDSLEKNLQHLLQGELRSTLRLGAIDAVTLSSADCSFEIKLATPGNKAPNCQTQVLKASDDIKTSQNTPTLFATRQIANIETGPSYWLQATLALNQSWFSQQTELSRKFEEQSLNYFPNQEKSYDLHFLLPQLSKSTNTAISSSALGLYTSDYSKYLLLLTESRVNKFLPELLWCLLAWQLLQGFLLITLQRYQHKSAELVMQKFRRKTEKVLPELSNDIEKLDLDVILEQISDSCHKRFEDWDSTNSKLQEQVKDISDEMLGAKQKLRTMRAKRVDTTYGQIDRKIMLFIVEKSCQRQIFLAEESSTIKAKIINLQNNTLEPMTALLKQWRAGIEIRGARKFIRSLDETEYKKGISNLEQQLSTVILSHQESLRLFAQVETSSNRSNRVAQQQRTILQCLQQLIQKSPLPCHEFLRHLQTLNDFYNGFSAGRLALNLVHNLTEASPSLKTNVLPILHYFYHLLFTTQDVLKMPSIIHKMELSENALVHAFYFTSHADWIQRNMRKDRQEPAIEAMLEWAEQCDIKIHIIPQGRDSCALIIRERLEAENTLSSVRNSQNDSSSQAFLQ